MCRVEEDDAAHAGRARTFVWGGETPARGRPGRRAVASYVSVCARSLARMSTGACDGAGRRSAVRYLTMHRVWPIWTAASSIGHTNSIYHPALLSFRTTASIIDLLNFAGCRVGGIVLREYQSLVCGLIIICIFIYFYYFLSYQPLETF